MPWTLLLLVQLMTMVSQAAFHYLTWARPGRGSERREGPEPTPSEDVRGPGQSIPVPLTWSSTPGSSQLVLLSLIISTLHSIFTQHLYPTMWTTWIKMSFVRQSGHP